MKFLIISVSDNTRLTIIIFNKEFKISTLFDKRDIFVISDL